jgi:hypothetical protein
MSHYSPPPSKCGIITCEDCQEVTRSALVKGIESKMAMLYMTRGSNRPLLVQNVAFHSSPSQMWTLLYP